MGARALATLVLTACRFDPALVDDAGPGSAQDAPPSQADAPPSPADAPPPADASGPQPDAPPSAAVLVQQAGSAQNAVQSLTATFAAMPAAGDVLILAGASSAGSLTAVSGDAGSGWVHVTGSYANADVEIYEGIATGSGTHVTLGYTTTSPSEMFVSVSEWSGLDTANLLDGHAPTSGNASGGSNSAASAGSVTTTHAPDLLVFTVSSKTALSLAPPDATWLPLDAVLESEPVRLAVWYQVATLAGAAAPTVPSPGKWDASLAAFRVK